VGARRPEPLTPGYRAIFGGSLADQAKGGEGNSKASGTLEELMKRRKFISAVPAAILLAQRPSAAIAQTRKKGVMLMSRIGPSSSHLCVDKADGHDKRMLTGSLWDDAIPLYIRAKAY
jgi:hypothetical protein